MANEYDEGVKSEVQELYEKDPMSVSDITEKTGVPERTIYRWAMKSNWRRFYSTPEAARQRSEIAAKAKYRAREAQERGVVVASALVELSSAKIEETLDLISAREMIDNPNLFKVVATVYKQSTDQLPCLEIDSDDSMDERASPKTFNEVYEELVGKLADG